VWTQYVQVMRKPSVGGNRQEMRSILIVFCCSETAFGVAKLLAEVIESALIVS